jgi:hypothetical protein
MGAVGAGAYNGTQSESATALNMSVDGTNVTGAGNHPGGRFDFVTRGTSSTGQYSLGLTAMTIRNGGNVGIGTVNPAAKLDVAGVIRATDICDETGANCKDISSGWGAGGDIDGVYTGTGLTGGFASGSGTLAVDVGTTTGKIVQMAASDKLPAVDGSNLTNVTATSVTAGAGTVGAPSITFSGDLDTGWWHPAANTLAASTAGAERVRIDSSGNVGIGTTSPGAPLHIYSGSTLGLMRIQGTGDASDFAAIKLISDEATDKQWHISHRQADLNALYFNFHDGTSWSTPMMIKSSGNVGIGTTNPATKLDVAGTITATGFSGPVSTSVGTFGLGTAGAPSITFTGDTNTGIWSPGADTIAFSTAGGERVRIDSSGNIGFGMSPTTKVEIYGGETVRRLGSPTFPFQLVADSESLHTYVDDNDAVFISEQDENAGPAGGFNFVMDDDGTATPAFKVSKKSNTAGMFTVLSNGNVGIGTTSPGNLLHIYNSQDAATYLKVQNPNTGTSASSELIAASDAGSVALGMNSSTHIAPAAGAAYVWNYANTNLLLGTNNLVRMVITNGGNVGIGSTAPVSKLDVNGTITATGFSGPLSTSVGTFGLGTVGAPSITFTGNTNTGWWSPGADTVAASTAGAERVRIDSSGKIGIGTNSPIDTLDVNGGVASKWAYAQDAGAAVYPNISALAVSTSGEPQYLMKRARGTVLSSPAAVSDGDTAGSIIARVHNGTQYEDAAAIRIYTDGTNVTGAGNHPGGNIQFATRGTTQTGQYSTTTVMTIRNSGNVGIGTTNPASKLDVNGTITATGFSGPLSTSVGTFGLGTVGAPSITFTGDTNTGWWSPGADTLAASTNGGERMRIDSSGKVAIGTTSPQYPLHIDGAASASATAIGLLNNTSGHTGSDGLVLGLANDASSTWIWNYENSPFRIATNNTERVRVDAAGNVGIGTTAPSDMLQVAGNIRTTNNGYFYASNTGISQMLLNSSTGNWGTIQNDATNVWSLGYRTTLSSALGTPVLTWNTSGNVGIGTAAPTSKLTVGTAFTLSANSSVLTTNAGALGATAGNELNLASIGFAASNETHLGIHAYRASAGSDWTTSAIGLGMDVDNTTRAGANIWLHANGNVGIGTTNPAAKLDVNGIIRATNLCDETGANCKDISTGWSAGPAGANTQIQYNSSGSMAGSANFVWDNANSRVGIGTGAPRADLDVNGVILSAPAASNGTTTVDYSVGNIQYTTLSCQAFQLNNLKDGGSYTFVVQGGTSATCSFTAYTGVGTGALTVHMPLNHAATIAAKHTIYSFMVAGSHVYFSWIPGY